MAIKVSCACGKSLSVKDDFAGRKVKCPGCQKLLLVPAAEEFAEDDFAEESAAMPQKTRGGEKSTARGKGTKKGKKSSGSNRGLMIGLVSGGGVLVVGLLTWMLWPSKPDVVAEAPAANAVGTPATAGAGGTAINATPAASTPETPTGGMASQSGTPSVEVATTPTVTTPAPSTELIGDLKTLQGTWQVSDVALPPELPKDRAAVMIAQTKLLTWTIKDNVLTMSTPQTSLLSTIKLDPTQTPKTIDLIPLDGERQLVVGLYSIEGETWKLCMTESGKRLQEMKPDQAMLLTFQRGIATNSAPAAQFDIKAWQAAEGKLKAMKVSAVLEPVFGQSGFPKECTHVVLLDPPATADGTMSPELWAIVTSLNYVQARLVSSTDATLQQLAQHPGLLGIHIGGKSTITAKGITSLKGCPNLRSLHFGEVPVSPELLGAVSQLGELRTFGINNAPVTNEMLGSISQMSQLETLNLYNTGTTDEDTVQIAKLTKLKTLFLDGAKVTDAGLQTLKSLKDLTMFSVRGLNVTPQAVADFEAALPKCKVQK